MLLYYLMYGTKFPYTSRPLFPLSSLLSDSLSTLIYDSFQVFTPICAAFYDTTIQKNSHGHLHKLVIEANETERKR